MSADNEGLGGKILISILKHGGDGMEKAEWVNPGSTLRELYTAQMPGSKDDDFLLRINLAEPSVGLDTQLRHGDRITMTPRKTGGSV